MQPQQQQQQQPQPQPQPQPPQQPVHPDLIRTLALEAVRKNGYALVHAAEQLRGDREIVLEAVRQNGEVLQNCVN
jgi:hypothetical protein